ncbi:hypothetical protein OAV88_00975 [bacterium]|jgi:solute carrier family 25 (mitochondrial phosphate transporter), member 23/24/25/41|nr:hypothetical protein [bacterium]
MYRSVFDSYFFRLKERLVGKENMNRDSGSGSSKNRPNNKKSKSPSMFRLLAAGAGAGATTKTCVAPLERIKILFQIQGMMVPKSSKSKSSQGGKYQNIGHAFRRIYQEEGVLSFWKGNGTNVLRVIPVYALKFGFNDKFKAIVRRPNQKKLDISQLIVSGTMAGLFQACITYPLETVRTRLTLGRTMGAHYDGIVHCFATTVRVEGVRGLYKGLGPTILSGAPYVGLQMTFFELFGRLSVSTMGQKWTEDHNIISKLTTGSLAGITAQTITYPGDTIRRRMQTNGMKGEAKIYSSSMDCARKIIAKEGWGGLFKGLRVNVIRAIPGAGIQFLAYDTYKKFLGC